MATISVVFTSNSGTVTGIAVLASDDDMARILAAEKVYLATADDQATADLIAYNLTAELIGNTTTIERNQIQVRDIGMVKMEEKPVPEEPAPGV